MAPETERKVETVRNAWSDFLFSQNPNGKPSLTCFVRVSRVRLAIKQGFYPACAVCRVRWQNNVEVCHHLCNGVDAEVQFLVAVTFIDDEDSSLRSVILATCVGYAEDARREGREAMCSNGREKCLILMIGIAIKNMTTDEVMTTSIRAEN